MPTRLFSLAKPKEKKEKKKKGRGHRSQQSGECQESPKCVFRVDELAFLSSQQTCGSHEI